MSARAAATPLRVAASRSPETRGRCSRRRGRCRARGAGPRGARAGRARVRRAPLGDHAGERDRRQVGRSRRSCASTFAASVAWSSASCGPLALMTTAIRLVRARRRRRSPARRCGRTPIAGRIVEAQHRDARTEREPAKPR